MSENIIYNDEYVKMFCIADGVYIETFKKGFPLNHLNNIFSSHPEIDITNYNILKNSICTAPKPPEKFGKLKNKVVVELTDSNLQAYITFNLSAQELEMKNREKLINESMATLKEKGVVLGVKKEVFFEEIKPGKPYLIAEGTPPVDGADAIIKMYQLKESIPEVYEDEKANFYELKLINKVKADDWLGERIEATEGISGQALTGEVIQPIKGKTALLMYDKNTVKEVFEGDKTVLYARINGAANYIGDKITVSNHLEIDGDVGFKTGNIKFDGYITIKGTVTDGFIVEATKDIEINGQLGIGNAREIISTHGSIFIKGGIASKGKTEIKAAKDVFTKFVDNVVINCGGTVHVGFYCINSRINAKEIIIDSPKGQIMGGNIKAEIKVLAPIIGCDVEKKTVVEVSGFDRDALKEELAEAISKINELKAEQQKLKARLSSLDEKKAQFNPFQRKEYDDGFERMLEIKEEVKSFEEKKKNISSYLKTRGDGEICVTKKIFPNCTLILRKRGIEITTDTLATTFYFSDGEIKQC